MDIPTDDDGRFEAVDENDTVVGRGTVADDRVEFEHVGVGEMVTPDGSRLTVSMPLPEFETTWPSLPQSRHLTLRAAE